MVISRAGHQHLSPCGRRQTTWPPGSSRKQDLLCSGHRQASRLASSLRDRDGVLQPSQESRASALCQQQPAKSSSADGLWAVCSLAHGVRTQMNHAGERTRSSGPQASETGVKPQINNNPCGQGHPDSGVPGAPSQGVNPLDLQDQGEVLKIGGQGVTWDCWGSGCSPSNTELFQQLKQAPRAHQLGICSNPRKYPPSIKTDPCHLRDSG